MRGSNLSHILARSKCLSLAGTLEFFTRSDQLSGTSFVLIIGIVVVGRILGAGSTN